MDIATWIQITMQYCNVRILTVIKMVDNNLGGGGEMGGGGGVYCYVFHIHGKHFFLNKAYFINSFYLTYVSPLYYLSHFLTDKLKQLLFALRGY